MYRESKQNGIADCLNRFPLPTNIKEIPVSEESIMLLEHLDQTPVTYQEIAKLTKKDTVLLTIWVT